MSLRLRLLLPAALVLALFASSPGPARGAEGEDEAPAPAPERQVRVPDVRRLRPLDAARRLTAVGLNVGRLFEIRVPVGWQHGLVVQQAPPPSTPEAPQLLPVGGEVALAVSAAQDGPAGGRPSPEGWPRVTPPPPPAPPPPVPPPPEAGPSEEAGPSPDDELPLAPSGVLPIAPLPAEAPALPPPPPAPPAPPERRPPDPVLLPVTERPPAPPPVALPPLPSLPDARPPDARPEAPSPALPALPPSRLPVASPGAPRATGSPDAPAPAPKADPGRVPALIGLKIADAEHQASQAEMTLYVERVAGQPVGHVLEQIPGPGQPRPPAGVVKVVVAAGGDHRAELAPPPLVTVSEIAVPDLLDRTPPQVERILEDLGLVAALETAERGPAGRVADQEPAAGTVVPKGATVVVRVAPDRPRPAAEPAPARPDGPAEPDRPPGPVPEGAPVPLAPAAATAMGGERGLAVGFTWRAVGAADAYVVEVEEQGADGWLPIARQVSRTSAVVVEVERLATPPGVLRWRVLAVVRGRRGEPCPWVVLR